MKTNQTDSPSSSSVTGIPLLCPNAHAIFINKIWNTELLMYKKVKRVKMS